jgi:hypothetical protein
MKFLPYPINPLLKPNTIFMRKVILQIVLAIMLMTNAVMAQAVWTQRTSFPGNGRAGAIGIGLGTKGYAGLGVDDNGIWHSDFWEFIPASNTWQQMPDFPGGPRFGASAFTVNNRLFVGFGSYTPGDYGWLWYNDLWEFDVAQNQWIRRDSITGQTLPSPRYFANTFTIGGKAYLGSGSYRQDRGTNAAYLNDFWEYDPVLNLWTSKAPIPEQGRMGGIGMSIGNKGYIGLGMYYYDTRRYDIWEYNPLDNSWTQKANYPGSGPAQGVAFGLGSKGYVGTGSNYAYYNDFYEFDPIANQWTKQPDFPGTVRAVATGFTIGNKAYIGLGAGNPNDFNDFWEYGNPATVNFTPLPAFTAFSTTTGIPSAAQTFTITGTSLQGNASITAPGGFELSLNQSSGYTSSLTLSPVNGQINATLIYIRLAAMARGSVLNGNIELASEGAPTQRIFINGSVLAATVFFDPMIVKTVAGKTVSGNINGDTSIATFQGPTGVAADSWGNIYIADQSNNTIRKISATGVVSTLAGNGMGGYADGLGTAARFYGPKQLALDAAGNIFVADEYNNAIRKITPEGLVTTVAGPTTGLHDPRGIVLDNSGNIYVADCYNYRICKIDATGLITTFAGGSFGDADGVGSQAQFDEPVDLTMDAYGNLFVNDIYGNIRKITPNAVVSTIIPPGMSIFKDGITVDPLGNLYISGVTGPSNNSIFKVTPNNQATIFAGGVAGFLDGIGTAAKFGNPAGLATDNHGKIYVADRGTNSIREIIPQVFSFNGYAGTASNVQSFTISATNLSGNAILNIPAGFEASLIAGSGFANNLTIPSVAGSIVSQPVYVRLKGTIGAGNYNDSMLLSAPGALSQKLLIVGKITDTVPPVLQCPNLQPYCYNAAGQYTISALIATDISGIKSVNYTVSGATTRSGTSLDASGAFNTGSSIITWTVADGAGNISTCQSSVRVNLPLNVSIPDVYPLLIWGQKNTIYLGVGPTCLQLNAMPTGGTKLPGNNYTYSWSNGASSKTINVCPASAGTYVYSVTVTDSLGCQAITSKTIIVMDIRCGKNTVHICWPGRNGNTGMCVSQGEAAILVFFGARFGYCTGLGSTANNSNSNAIAELSLDKKITVYPNPNTGSFSLQLANIQTSEIRVIDQSGRIIYRQLINGMEGSRTLQINLGAVAKGLYIIQAIGKDGIFNSKFVVQQ